MFQFEWLPVFAALPLPWLVRLLAPPAQRKQAALKVPFLEYFRRDDSFGRRPRAVLALATLAWLLLVVAAARPQWIEEHTRVPQSGRDLLLALDISDSMSASDFVLNQRRVNRLKAAQTVAADFIEKRRGDRIGIIVYATRPALQMPLSFDIDTAKDFIKSAFIGLVDKRSTAIGDAIGFAIRHLSEARKSAGEDAGDRAGDRVLILLTDGQSNAGKLTPEEAIEIASLEKLRVYTIGVGSKRGRHGLDERMLQKIADKTGGRYFYAADTNRLQKVYEIIDRLESLEREEQTFRTVSSLFVWPLALALLPALAVVVLARAR